MSRRHRIGICEKPFAGDLRVRSDKCSLRMEEMKISEEKSEEAKKNTVLILSTHGNVRKG